jgi:hypothetical protein
MPPTPPPSILDFPPSNFMRRLIQPSFGATTVAELPIVSELPLDLLSVFVYGHEKSAPLTRVPLYAVAEVGIVRNIPSENQGVPSMRVPLGMIGTDHIGYASFDLTVLRQTSIETHIIAEIKRANWPDTPDDEPKPVLGLRRLFVFPFADPSLRVDALEEGELGPDVLVLQLKLDALDLVRRESAVAMASMQSPSILDWRISPSSFSLNGAMLVGEDGCETFVPANLSTQQFRFTQVARTPHTHVPQAGTDAVGRTVTLGFAYEYLTEWFGVGHSLGQVQYSLPLAPAEKVKIAVVDWSRQDRAIKQEETSFKESLVHDWTRDRTISETVHSVLNASREGGSLMGGVGGSLASGGLGAAISLGGAYTTSSDRRDLETASTQRIADAFHQASSAERELRSTVVVQGTQAEAASVQTRTIANYNHSHALTILYYEVLRHYRVVTRLANRRLAVFIDYSSEKLDFKDKPNALPGDPTVEDLIAEHRRTLEAVLLDEGVRPGFDAVQRLLCLRRDFKHPNTHLVTEDFILTQFLVKIKTGATGTGSADLFLLPKEGEMIRCRPVNRTPNLNLELNLHNSFNNQFHGIHPNTEDWFQVVLERPVRWGNVMSLQLSRSFDQQPGAWEIKHVHACANAEAIYWVMADSVPPEPPLVPGALIFIAVNRYVPSAEDMLTPEERCALKRLRAHLEKNAFHYSRAIWWAEDPGVRADRFAPVKIGNTPLLDLIANTPVEVVEKWVVFPINAGFEKQFLDALELRVEQISPPSGDYIEQLLTLPARGVFAEAKLGHCNASEVIDNTRFWDWQQSPIPDNAPEITGTKPGPQGTAQTAPTGTALPASIINIATPPAVPDPTGMKDSLALLGALGALRDESGSSQLGALLGTLSNNATSLASIGARSAETKQLMDQIRQAKEIPADKRADLIGKLLEGRVVGATQSSTGSPSGPSGPSSPSSPSSPSNPSNPSNPGNPSPGTATPSNPSTGAPKTTTPATATPAVGSGPAKTSLLGRVNPEEAAWTFAFQDFHEIGAVQAVWGHVEQTTGGVAEIIRREAPVDKIIHVESRNIHSAGKIILHVQLASPAAPVLQDVVSYVLDHAMSATIVVRPKVKEFIVVEASEAEARKKVIADFATQFLNGSIMELTLAKTTPIPSATPGGPATTQYRFLALREGLEFA